MSGPIVSWCPHCMPQLSRSVPSYQADVQFVASFCLRYVELCEITSERRRGELWRDFLGW